MMRFVPTAIVGVALLAAASLVQAEEASGVIASVDPEQRTIVLEDGQTFTLADGVAIEGLEPGAEVLVSFEEQADGKVAMVVAPAQ